MLLDDLRHVGERHVPVPRLLGVDDHGASGLALVEATGGVGAHPPLQAAHGDFLLERLADLLRALLGAGALGVVGVAEVDADEDVFLELGHQRSISLAMMSFWISLVPS